jgi:SAM-dependent methyltransferase
MTSPVRSEASVASPAESRAALSRGTSDEPLYRTVLQLLDEERAGGTLLDVGCGRGELARRAGAFDRYIGCDLVQYEGFVESERVRFVKADLNDTPYPLPDASADWVVAVETIEHLENPRAFTRELYRLVKPGGGVVITTPNQLSLLSKASLLWKNQFSAFQEREGLYPAHITALVEEDLKRIAREAGFDGEALQVRYTSFGRIPGTARHWPSWLKGRAFSDNVALLARRRDA